MNKLYFLHFRKTIRAKLFAEIFKTNWFKNIGVNNPKRAISLLWFADYGRKFNWKNPRNLNEKILWLSVNSDTTQWSQCTDKYAVRDYVKACNLSDILTKCYAIEDKFENINFDSLPNAFAIKCTHDQGSTRIVPDKSKINFDEFSLYYNKCLGRRIGDVSGEPHYLKIQPRIMIEELIPFSQDVTSVSQIDYKFWCFNGKVHHCFICYDRNAHDVSFNTYSVSPWKERTELLSKAYRNKNIKPIPEPANLSEMIEIAEKLAKPFPVVRVDLYNDHGKIYFGELTFTSCAGRMSYFSPEALIEMGELIPLNR